MDEGTGKRDWEMKRILSPSILAADFKVLGEQIRICEENGAGYLHFDVMDGVFVPSISFGLPVLESLKGATNLTLDVHLMIAEPIRYVEEFARAGADILTVHYEACKNLQETLDMIHACGVKAGVVINPALPTPGRDVPLNVGGAGVRRTSVHPAFL